MAGLTPVLTKSFKAGGTIAARTLVKFGADDQTVVAAAAVGDLILGVTTDLPVVAGETVDVILVGIGEAIAGGTITRGALLTSNATGQVVAAAPAAGANNRIAGVAIASAAANDIIAVLITQASLQG
jgi:hypothetical protein